MIVAIGNMCEVSPDLEMPVLIHMKANIRHENGEVVDVGTDGGIYGVRWSLILAGDIAYSITYSHCPLEMRVAVNWELNIGIYTYTLPEYAVVAIVSISNP
jgi:hypothetical protein